jgi:deoxyribose-phosphate aldolase
MAIKRADRAFHESGKTDALRSWIMVVLTLALVLLYAAVLLGWFKPMADEKMALRLEPIIFVIIGYCFGRLPSQQNEQTLKEEISRHAQKVDAVQATKEQALETLAALEEKVKNVTTAIKPAASRQQLERSGTHGVDDKLRGSLVAALEILNS